MKSPALAGAHIEHAIALLIAPASEHALLDTEVPRNVRDLRSWLLDQFHRLTLPPQHIMSFDVSGKPGEAQG